MLLKSGKNPAKTVQFVYNMRICFDFLCIRLAQYWKQNLGNGWKWYKTYHKFTSKHRHLSIFNPTWTYLRPGPNWMHHEHHHSQSPANQSRHCKAKGHIFRCLWNFQVKTTSRCSVGKNRVETMCYAVVLCLTKSIFVGLEIVETSMFCSVPSCKAGQTELHFGTFAEKVKTPYQPIQCDQNIWKDGKFINLCINTMAALSAMSPCTK